MKKIILPILACLLLSCKDETIPVVTVSTLPAELVGLCKDTLYDSLFYQKIMDILADTITPDSIVYDTIRIDTFSVDTFYMDTIRLCGKISYAGAKPYGPALQEYGFCINDLLVIPMYKTSDLKTPESDYGEFSYTMVARNTDEFFVHAYAINPSGQIRGDKQRVRLSSFDTR